MQSAAFSPGTPDRLATSPAESAADQQAAIYLQALRSLSSEFSSAIRAIASNKPVQFLESTRIQESLSVEVVGLAQSIRHNEREASHKMSATRAVEIEESERLVHDLLRTYSALLQRSAKNTVVQARLHSSYLEVYPGAEQPDSSKATWSCEG